MTKNNSNENDHFNGREAIEHVAEAHAKGLIASSEIHGAETPGHISALADAARDTALVLLLVWTILIPFHIAAFSLIKILAVFSFGWSIWKCGRSAWLGWSRLERLHRILEQERWEIQHQRPQERLELQALYSAKGLEGKLLDDVLDVLMADDNRLLRVMVEEELGLSLESHEHPLKQGLGALIGSLLSALTCLIGLVLSPHFGIIVASLMVMGICGVILAYHAKNRLVSAAIWNIGLGALSFGTVYFLLEYLFQMVIP